MVIAPTGQAPKQAPQPEQPTLQTLTTSFLSILLQHKTATDCFIGWRTIRLFGQTYVHAPQPVHFSRLTSATPLSLINNAP
jgi:hypothetical protein